MHDFNLMKYIQSEWKKAIESWRMNEIEREKVRDGIVKVWMKKRQPQTWEIII